LTPESTNESTNESKKKKDIGLTSIQILEKHGVTGQLAKDFLAVRKAKKSAMTVTAMEGISREASKAGIETSEAIKICVENSWAGFKSSWEWKAPENKKQQEQEIVWE
jgi:hypothetical protein